MFSPKIDALINTVFTVFAALAAYETTSLKLSAWIPVSFAIIALTGVAIMTDFLTGNPIVKRIAKNRSSQNT